MKKVEQIHQVRKKKWDLTGDSVWTEGSKDPVGVEEDVSWDQVHDISRHCLSTWHIWKTLENNDPSKNQIRSMIAARVIGLVLSKFPVAKWPRSIKIQP